MITPHDIQTVPEEEQNALLAANDKTNNERLSFEYESPYILFKVTTSLSI